MTTETTIYGIQNCAYHNVRAGGDVSWYRTEAERDAALAELREQAISGGLASSAARSGIYGVELTDAEVDPDGVGGGVVEWVEWYGEAGTGRRGEMLDEVGL